MRIVKEKSALSILLAFFVAASAFSLPGFEPFIGDMSGEYVYYADKTFSRDSYVGFLAYDERTYAARYFAPANKSQKKPELELTIYFTIDASKNFMELTGEKIVSAHTPDDTEIINYLHDMVYELNARRTKAGSIAPSEDYFENGQFLKMGVRKTDDFMQFGGNVSVVYDYLIPLFNIKAIESESGLPLFYAVTTGRIVSSSDTSFEDFEGLPEKFTDTKRSFKKHKKATASQFTYDERVTIHLDSQWEQSMENVWKCQDSAFLSIGAIPQNHTIPSEGEEEHKVAVSPFIVRQLIQSVGNSYVDLKSVDVKNNASSSIISAVFFQPDSGTATENIKSVQKTADKQYVISLTVFKNLYDKNKTYFDGIINGVEIK